MASTNIQSVGAVQAVINEARTMAHATLIFNLNSREVA